MLRGGGINHLQSAPIKMIIDLAYYAPSMYLRGITNKFDTNLKGLTR